jgi:predicted small metal-binding protein
LILLLAYKLKSTKDLRNTLTKTMWWNQMFVLACRETGLDCDFVVRGNTKKEFLKNGADHIINQHGMDAKEIYWDEIPVNFLCQSFSKVNVD